jgi:HTH-type transcriptional regulator / antitoxin MqsA
MIQSTYKPVPHGALCAICGQGSVTSRTDQVESKYKGTKAMVPLHYTVCSACASDFADAEQGRLNKLDVLAFRKSVDDGCSFNAN